MNVAGTLGFAPDPRAALDWSLFGAFVTNPLSRRPRAPAANPEFLPYPGGFLLHSGWPNPGFSAVLKHYAPRWADSNIPIIVHLLADQPAETAQMAQRLEGLENIAAIELGFAPHSSPDFMLSTLQMALGELPLIVALPWEQVLTLGPRLIQAGALAVSLATPRGTLNTSAGAEERLATGRLYGPGLFPQTLEIARNAAQLGLPVIAAGGVYSREQVRIMLAAGAMAVQVDAALWRSDSDFAG
jgi:dihydroorotate dehydrogenase (NAD+) catalytic subunit